MRPAPAGVSQAISPAYCIAAHNVGKIALSVTNYGIFGAGAAGVTSAYIKGLSVDCFTGAQLPDCEYPKGSGTEYLYSGNFWIGAVVGRDTLVSVGADGWQMDQEFNPDNAPFGNMIYRSIMDPSRPEFDNAVSEQDFIAKYTDTLTSGVAGLRQDFIDGRPHRPLHIEVNERSYAWSYSYAEDFVLFDYSITNIGRNRLTRVYMGVYVDADVGGLDNDNRPNDDLCGFLFDVPSPKVFSGNCTEFRDTVNLAWIADNDGDLSRDIPVPNITGTRIVRTPAETLDVSFNWWVGNVDASRDFGPQTIAKARDLGTGGEGTPEGDRNKYAFMRNKEFDYDQIYTASIPVDDPVWRYPNQRLARDVSKGFDTRYLLSFGPFTLDPGQTVPISLAYVGGEHFHVDRNNGKDNLVDNYRPELWYKNVDFTDFALNSMWASWLYDNPGYDTDDDGYRGKFRVCPDSVQVYDTISIDPLVIDTSWAQAPDTLYYQGDNVPDFRGASPPPAPNFWLEPSNGRIRVRFNGTRSENTEDVFSHVKDFEGYRVYLGLDERPSSQMLVESFDVQDFNKYVFNQAKPGGAGWELHDNPFTLSRLQALYGSGSTAWDPLQFTPNHPFLYQGGGAGNDSMFYFAKQDYNNWRPGVDTRIRRTFPDEPMPPVAYLGYRPDSALATLPSDTLQKYFMPDGWLKYYEYEVVLEPLLPTVPYYVNVTAFDFGSPSSGLASLETSPTIGSKVAFPQGPPPAGDTWKDSVYVYPNPYRINGNYLADGFEGRDANTRDNAPDRKRMVNFANLPPTCTIRIYTLDGDLVKEINHKVDPADPLSSHDRWDLITRNTQLVVSGLYYWTVEDDKGNVQIGKLVVIM
ncbi:hypothetical protein C3F09_07120 [candidate division GN15 bacterium]|uniref:T9SS C-terminal target domain-containing protein n=1 Tax=candidate division GN15 bacterium TaxID=2072418 RepID=A0A855X072_9BACT|nr:MAG: hypothetical protein C3F09_07120 [candidate division GN15 bacterium]